MSKGKPPAFQFYADDFLAGTMDMTSEEAGSYIRLLCHQWNRGSIPAGTAGNRGSIPVHERLAGGPVSDLVLSKFVLCRDGMLRNARMEAERKKQAAFRAAQSIKGRKSGLSRRTVVQPGFNRGSTEIQPALVEPEVNSPSPLPFPFPSPETETKDRASEDAPITTEPVVAHEKPAMRAFTDGWSTAWRERFGTVYDFKRAKDGAAAAALIKLKSPDELVAIAKRAWNAKDRQGKKYFRCHLATSIADFRCHFNAINVELAEQPEQSFEERRRAMMEGETRPHRHGMEGY